MFRRNFTLCFGEILHYVSAKFYTMFRRNFTLCFGEILHYVSAKFYAVNIKVKQSRYRPGVTQKGSRKLRFPDFITTAQDVGKVVSLRYRPHLPPGNTPGTHFC